jgi:hypothetical protein
MTSGFSKTSFSTAKNLNCLNLENESSILDEAIGFQKKLERDTHDRLMSKKEDVILESVTDYAKNPDTYDKNIESCSVGFSFGSIQF